MHTRIYKFRCEFHKDSINLSPESSHVNCFSWRPVLFSHASFLICLFEFSSVCQGCERGWAISQKHSQKITADAPLAIHARMQQRMKTCLQSAVAVWSRGGEELPGAVESWGRKDPPAVGLGSGRLQGCTVLSAPALSSSRFTSPEQAKPPGWAQDLGTVALMWLCLIHLLWFGICLARPLLAEMPLFSQPRPCNLAAELVTVNSRLL